MKIDITGLPKEQVIIALFENVYRKSELSKSVWLNIANYRYLARTAELPRQIGFDTVPDDFEIKRELITTRGDIDYIGAVAFKINFSGNEIDVSDYDLAHKTDSTPGIQTAAACITQLKEKIRILEEAQTRIAIQLGFITDVLKDFLHTELTVSCDAYETKTRVRIGNISSQDTFLIPGNIAEIFNIFFTNDCEAYLLKVEEQYLQLTETKSKEAEKLQFVTDVLKARLKVNLTLIAAPYINSTTVTINSRPHSGLTFSIPETIAQLFKTLSDSDREVYLSSIEQQYQSKKVDYARRVLSMYPQRTNHTVGTEESNGCKLM